MSTTLQSNILSNEANGSYVVVGGGAPKWADRLATLLPKESVAEQGPTLEVLEQLFAKRQQLRGRLGARQEQKSDKTIFSTKNVTLDARSELFVEHGILRGEHRKLQAKLVEVEAQLLALKEELKAQRSSDGKKIAALKEENEKLRREAHSLVGPVVNPLEGRATALNANPESGRNSDNFWVHALPDRDQRLLEPKVMDAVEKLLKLKGKVTYSTERGPRAQGPHGWMRNTLVAPNGPLTEAELQLIPQRIFRRFDAKLYQALQDAKQRAKKRVEPS